MTQPGGLFSFGSAPTQQQQQPGAAPFSFGQTGGSALGGQQPATGGFGFGTAGAQAPAGSAFGGASGTGFSFGQQPQQQQQQQQPSFGQPQQQQQQQQQPGFGQPAAAPSFGSTSGGGLFGQPATAAAPQASTGFSFGTPAAGTSGFGAAAPATSTGQAGTGFGFGGQTGGTGTTGGFGFGTQQAQPGASSTAPATGFSFGTPASSAAPSFGAPAPAVSAAPATGFSFGTPAATSAPSLFGAPAAAPTSAPATGFSFGTPAATTTAGSTGFGFSAPGATAQAATTSAPATGFSFGTPAAPTTAAAAAPFSFKPTTSVATSIASSAPGTLGGFSFGAPSTATTATSSAAPTSAPTLGTSLFSTPTTAATSAAPAATTSMFSFGTKLGAPATTATTGFTGFTGLGSLGATTTTVAATTTSATSTGLGGVPKFATTGAESSFAFGTGGTDGKTENRALQELPLPQEMLVLVEELKNQIKSDKLKFTELSRSNNDAINAKVSEEIEEVRGQVTVIANLIQKQQSNCEVIRNLIHQGIADAEMANQIRETPLSSQAEINTPIQYFFRIVDNYRERMHIYLREIAKAESSLSYVLSAPASITAKELYDTLNMTRNSVIALSAKVQILHEEVVRAVEAHRNLQRYLVGEASDFSAADRASKQNLVLKPLNREVEDFSRVSVLFPHKIVEPPKIGPLSANQPLTPGKSIPFTGLTALTSTPIRNPALAAAGGARGASDSIFYQSNPLFQTQQSTILSSSQLGGPPISPGASLKRSKR